MPGTDTRTGSRNYDPERFLQQNDSTQLLRASQEAANQDFLSQSYLGNQNKDAAYIRRRNANIDDANLNEQAKQNDSNRQERMNQAQMASQERMSQAQYASQERLAKAQANSQQNSAFLSNIGSADWRWW